MHHRSGLRKLNITDGAHRQMLLRNVGNAVIRHERVKTTLVLAKELRRYLEPLITLGKKPSLANRRLVFSRLRDRENVVKLFNDLGVRFTNRPGGYLRILKNGYRVGDNAPMALVELVDKKLVTIAEDDGKKKKKAKAKPKKAVDKPVVAEKTKEEILDDVEEKSTTPEEAEESDTEKTPESSDIK